jgi:hypothetical protein
MFRSPCLSLISVFFLVTLLTVSSFAEIEVTDPGAHLKMLPGHGNGVEFSKAFTCNQATRFFVKTGKCKLHCEFGLCEEQCLWPKIVEATFQPEECTKDSVAIYSSLGHEVIVTASDYEASSQSMALTLVKAISLFYDDIQMVRVDQILFPVSKKLIEDGQMKQITMTVVAVSLFPDKNKNESQGLLISLDLNQSGLNQLMCISSNNMCEPNTDYFIKRKGLVNAIF